MWHKINFYVLNSKFSFIYPSCRTKAKEARLSYYLPITGEKTKLIRLFFKGISEKSNKQLRPGFELRLLILFSKSEFNRLGVQNTPTASLQKGMIPPHYECPDNDIKQFDSEAPVMLELWGMRWTPSLPSLPGSLWLAVVALDRVLSMGQIELFDI